MDAEEFRDRTVRQIDRAREMLSEVAQSGGALVPPGPIHDGSSAWSFLEMTLSNARRALDRD